MTHRNYRRLGGTVIKNLPANTGDTGGGGFHLQSGRTPGRGTHSCLEKPMDRGAWWTTVRGIAKSQTGLSN